MYWGVDSRRTDEVLCLVVLRCWLKKSSWSPLPCCIEVLDGKNCPVVLRYWMERTNEQSFALSYWGVDSRSTDEVLCPVVLRCWLKKNRWTVRLSFALLYWGIGWKELMSSPLPCCIEVLTQEVPMKSFALLYWGVGSRRTDEQSDCPLPCCIEVLDGKNFPVVLRYWMERTALLYWGIGWKELMSSPLPCCIDVLAGKDWLTVLCPVVQRCWFRTDEIRPVVLRCWLGRTDEQSFALLYWGVNLSCRIYSSVYYSQSISQEHLLRGTALWWCLLVKNTPYPAFPFLPLPSAAPAPGCRRCAFNDV